MYLTSYKYRRCIAYSVSFDEWWNDLKSIMAIFTYIMFVFKLAYKRYFWYYKRKSISFSCLHFISPVIDVGFNILN